MRRTVQSQKQVVICRNRLKTETWLPRSLIGSHTWPIARRHFRWPCVTFGVISPTANLLMYFLERHHNTRRLPPTLGVFAIVEFRANTVIWWSLRCDESDVNERTSDVAWRERSIIRSRDFILSVGQFDTRATTKVVVRTTDRRRRLLWDSNLAVMIN